MSSIDKVNVGGTVYDIKDKNVTDMITTREENGATFSTTYRARENILFRRNDELYKVTSDVSVDDTIIENGNITKVTLNTELENRTMWIQYNGTQSTINEFFKGVCIEIKNHVYSNRHPVNFSAVWVNHAYFFGIGISRPLNDYVVLLISEVENSNSFRKVIYDVGNDRIYKHKFESIIEQ